MPDGAGDEVRSGHDVETSGEVQVRVQRYRNAADPATELLGEGVEPTSLRAAIGRPQHRRGCPARSRLDPEGCGP